MRKYIQSITAASLLLGVLSAVPTTSYAAEPSAASSVYIDGQQQENVLTLNGRTLVQLTAFNDPAWVDYNYEAKTKTVNITNKTNKASIRLTGGSMEADINGTKVKLDAPVTFKDGRTYVPLRFLSENLGGNVAYDAVGKKVVVRTPSGQKRFKTLMSGNLTEARMIAIRLPNLYGKDALQPLSEGFTIQYTFPKGETLRYFKEYKGLIDYVEINAEGLAEVKWQKDLSGLTLGPREKGTKPASFSEAVFFVDAVMADLTIYGTIDSTGKETELGRLDRMEDMNKGKFIVAIDGEMRTDSK
ncbi:hypothetical protein Back11_33020 [Paenibacillus baekrokdamisoli]|uniref:Copper amine oxidase-like N-terminal domain-containing protein n=1 Tax=Paenibacillus baekrokdamisoli TaxID=1712516 RepID=A0A3G9ISY1_9BACL|nr:copper amine oxidase N-terminal domain-containing protein [Paenibacillus baekrokdamisoli]MBB3071529.1 hypothetical protein [Paenibacillus baekrokdamisoli]BBH21957.1 hypothetical protein Back11_33020 [Paenibacillus baekrokdamisoli]